MPAIARTSSIWGRSNVDSSGVVKALVLIGAPGAGKTSVLEAVATLHDIEAVEHGAIEAEQLSLGRPLLPASSWVPQLGAVLSLQRDAGRRRFLISATVETADDLAAVRIATAAELALVVCLSASSETVAARIDAREPDHWPGKAPLIDRARKLASSTPRLPGIDLVVDTEQRAAEDVAAEIFQAMRSGGMLGSR
jgi:chloramphenicol 3-O-phosphotransferase